MPRQDNFSSHNLNHMHIHVHTMLVADQQCKGYTSFYLMREKTHSLVRSNLPNTIPESTATIMELSNAAINMTSLGITHNSLC